MFISRYTHTQSTQKNWWTSLLIIILRTVSINFWKINSISANYSLCEHIFSGNFWDFKSFRLFKFVRGIFLLTIEFEIYKSMQVIRKINLINYLVWCNLKVWFSYRFEFALVNNNREDEKNNQPFCFFLFFRPFV